MGTEFLQAFPQARVFVAAEGTFRGRERPQAMRESHNGNYGRLSSLHRSFESSRSYRDEYFKRFVQNQVAELTTEIGPGEGIEVGNRRI